MSATWEQGGHTTMACLSGKGHGKKERLVVMAVIQKCMPAKSGCQSKFATRPKSYILSMFKGLLRLVSLKLIRYYPTMPLVLLIQEKT